MMGPLERLHDRLRAQVQQQSGRDPQPIAVNLGRQSVKTAEKKWGAAMMLARRFRDTNAIVSSIPWD